MKGDLLTVSRVHVACGEPAPPPPPPPAPLRFEVEGVMPRAPSLATTGQERVRLSLVANPPDGQAHACWHLLTRKEAIALAKALIAAAGSIGS